MIYRTPNTCARYSFAGWSPGESPVECWQSGEWLRCLHGCMLAVYLIGDPHMMRAALADDGILHELVHLAAGAEVCTHGGMERLAEEVVALQDALARRLGVRYSTG